MGIHGEERVRAIAEAFAIALDGNDFDTALTMLAPTCRYDRTGASHPSEGVLLGPATIVASYRSHDDRARAVFDRVEYVSAVERVEGASAVIRFSDVLEKAGERHTYCCRQRITVNASSLIETIVHDDIPGEEAAVREFMARVGVKP